ncbi:MAG: 3-oxoacyl-ACP reductase FabG [Bacteroidales bacterium]|nr:3-oxoacyl-ACP reductase FabG [Bacteroidales bacterium]
MKIALVTGGSRGIGKAVSIALAREGFRVLINYISNEEAARVTLNQIIEEGGQAELLAFDVSKQEEVERAIGDWKSRNPEQYIHTLVNNAGIRKDNLLVFMPSDDWFNVLNTNLNSFYYSSRALIQDMIVNKGGRIVNIVSLSGIKGMPGQTNYSAAKGGVIAATKALAQEVGRKKITVNAVAPGFIKTDMTVDLDEKEYKRLIPMNRFGTAEEVADVVAFLVSEKASYITGEVISVNGGLHT